MSSFATRIWRVVSQGLGIEEATPSENMEDTSSKVRRRIVPSKKDISTTYVPPAERSSTIAKKKLHAKGAPYRSVATRSLSALSEARMPPTRSVHQERLFQACAKSWLKHEGMDRSPLLTSILQEFFRQANSKHARDDLLIQLRQAGLSGEGLDALRRSWRAIFTGMRTRILLEPKKLNIEAPPVYYEVRSGAQTHMRIRSIADAEGKEAILEDYRAEEIRMVIRDAMQYPVAIVTPHCGWHYDQDILPSVLQHAAEAKGYVFQRAGLEDPLTYDFGRENAMLVLEGFSQEPFAPSQELLEYLRSRFFARPAGQNGTPIERKLVLLLQSTWVRPESLAAPWSEPLTSLVLDPDTTLPRMGNVPLIGLPLRSMNIVQAWHLLDKYSTDEDKLDDTDEEQLDGYSLNIIRRVTSSGAPLLPLVLKALATRLKEQPRGTRSDTITRFAETLLSHANIDDDMDCTAPHSHLIIPRHGDWGAYLLRLQELAMRQPLSFQSNPDEFISMRTLALGEEIGAEDTYRISTPIPPEEMAPASAPVAEKEETGGQMTAAPVPIAANDAADEADATFLHAAPEENAGRYTHMGDPSEPSADKTIPEPPPASHRTDKEPTKSPFADTIEGTPPPGELLPPEAAVAPRIAVASPKSTAERPVLSRTSTYRFVASGSSLMNAKSPFEKTVGGTPPPPAEMLPPEVSVIPNMPVNSAMHAIDIAVLSSTLVYPFVK